MAHPHNISVATLPAVWGIMTRKSNCSRNSCWLFRHCSVSLKFRVHCVQVDLNDVESSTILSFRYITEMGEGLSGLEKRQALKDWLELLASSHPLKR